MAQTVEVLYFDDLDSTPLPKDVKPVRFGLDNVEYEIDLSERHQEELREVFGRYVPHARKVSGTVRRARGQVPQQRNANGASNAEIRAWAHEQGYDVAERGRIPADVMAAYAEAHRG